jgi:predicted alpha/beta hydrolase
MARPIRVHETSEATTPLAPTAPERPPLQQALRIRARDGYDLGADLFLPRGEVSGAVLLASAMAVPRGFYRRYAAYLAEGGLATMTLDYRGIGESAPRRLRGFRAALHDWAELDLDAALRELGRQVPGVPRLWVGHSVGGQLMGLVPELPIEAALLVASQAGWWGHWRGGQRVAMAALWHAAVPAIASTLGYLPMRAFGQGEDLPAEVAREWARWGRHRFYMKPYADAVGGAQFVRWAGRIRSYAIADDAFAPRPGIDALLAMFPHATGEVRPVTPEEFGLPSVGHFDFFKPMFQGSLWAESRGWLLGNADVARAD